MEDLIFCNLCGKEMDFFDLQEDYTLHKYVGYGSIYDGSEIEIRMCCKCFDSLVSNAAVNPIIEESEFSFDQNTTLNYCPKDMYLVDGDYTLMDFVEEECEQLTFLSE